MDEQPQKREPKAGTWGWFKRAVEAAGVKDDDVLGYIDWSTVHPDVRAHRDVNGGIAITC
jgi:hypothetical protein